MDFPMATKASRRTGGEYHKRPRSHTWRHKSSQHLGSARSPRFAAAPGNVVCPHSPAVPQFLSPWLIGQKIIIFQLAKT